MWRRVSPPSTKVVLVDASLALYRRYRPDTFADVIGQDHVTLPLSQALDLASRLAAAAEEGRVDLSDLGRRARRLLAATTRTEA